MKKKSYLVVNIGGLLGGSAPAKKTSQAFLNILNLKTLFETEQLEQLLKYQAPCEQVRRYCLIHVLLSELVFLSEAQ